MMDLKSKTDLLQYSGAEIERILARSNKRIENVGRDVELVKNWMKDQKHLPFIFNDRQILSFLNMSEFSLEKTKTCIDMYFTLKGVFPQFYSHGLNNPKLKTFTNNYNIFLLPKLTKNLGRIFISQVTDPTHFDCDVLFCMIHHIFEVSNSEDFNAGWEVILDLTHASEEMAEKFTAENMRKIFFTVEKTYLDNLRTVHVIAPTPVGERIMANLRASANPQMQERFFGHKSYAGVMDYFSKDTLPKDFGGNLRSLKEMNGDWQKFFQDHRAHLEKCMNARTMEKLRASKITDEDVLQFTGGFGKHIMS